jgi:hypothetical protein
VPRLILCAVVDVPGEREFLQTWMNKWKGRLSSVSENLGCGCCVDLFEVEGPDMALAEVPEKMRSADSRQGKHGA